MFSIDSFKTLSVSFVPQKLTQYSNLREHSLSCFCPVSNLRGALQGIYGLPSKLNQLWIRRKGYYLGEWHFHPSGELIPSFDDIKQMFGISCAPKTHCPEPILLIVAYSSRMEDFSCRIYIFGNRQCTELFQQ